MKSPNVVLEEYTARDERRLLSIQARRCLDRVCGTRAATSSLGRMVCHPVSGRGSAACLVLGEHEQSAERRNSFLSFWRPAVRAACAYDGDPQLSPSREGLTPGSGPQTSSQMTAGMVGGCGRRQRARACGRRGSAPGRGRRQRAGRGLPFRIHAGPLRPAGNGWEASAAPAMPPTGSSSSSLIEVCPSS